jgi:hypothetical protein
METKYYSIRSTFKKCSKEDFFQNGRIIENTTYYIKDETTLQFKDSYVIGSIYYNSITPSEYELTENYYLEEIEYLTTRNLVYKLDESFDLEAYNFRLYLKTASEFDIYYGATNHMIINTTYYCITGENKIVGPLKIEENHSGKKFRDFLNKGLLLVPTKKQTFETIKIAVAS